MLVLIKQNRVMTQNHQPILIVDLCVLLDALPIRAELSFHAVVVSLNQVLMTVELLDANPMPEIARDRKDGSAVESAEQQNKRERTWDLNEGYTAEKTE